jgi:cell division septum initiation protein DivIVA
MDLEELINILDDVVLDGMSLPLTNGKCIVDREKIKDIIQDIRLNYPNEIRQARSIVDERNELLAKANKEAENIIAKAEVKAEKISSQEEVLKIANAKANALIASAQAKAKDICQLSSEYSENLLQTIEDMLTKALLDVKQTRQKIRNLK